MLKNCLVLIIIFVFISFTKKETIVDALIRTFMGVKSGEGNLTYFNALRKHFLF